MYSDSEIKIEDMIFIKELNVLDIIGFDVILGIDWLIKHRASVNYWG